MGVKMKNTDKARPRLSDFRQQANNLNRHTERGMAMLESSMQEVGYAGPMVAAADGEIIDGSARHETAANVFGADSEPIVVESDGKRPIVVVRTDIKDAKSKAAKRLAAFANRTGEVNLEWDLPNLEAWLAEDAEAVKGMFGEDEIAKLLGTDTENTYTGKIVSPVYTPKGERPPVSALVDHQKTDELLAGIEAAKLPDEVAQFLKLAAERHTVFNFRQIAEFYCHADAKVQDLMERSGLVIIDFKKAIEYGFVHMTEKLGALADQEEEANGNA
jgi:hypothetical protein